MIKPCDHTMTTSTTPQPPTLSTVETRAIETLYRAFNEHNPDLLDEVCTPDWQDIPLVPGQGPGPEGLKRLMPGLWKAFPDLEIVVHDLIAAPGHVGVRASMVGTHLGEIHGVPPTGKKVNIALHEFHRLHNGKVTHTWHLEDWFGMLYQVGAWPPVATPQSK